MSYSKKSGGEKSQTKKGKHITIHHPKKGLAELILGWLHFFSLAVGVLFLRRGL